MLAALALISGHTIKHLLAAGAAAIIVGRLIERQGVGPADLSAPFSAKRECLSAAHYSARAIRIFWMSLVPS